MTTETFYVNQPATLDPKWFEPTPHHLLTTSLNDAKELEKHGIQATALLDINAVDDLPNVEYTALDGFSLDQVLQINPMLPIVSWEDKEIKQYNSLDILFNSGKTIYYDVLRAMQDSSPAIYQLAETIITAKNSEWSQKVRTFTEAFSQMDPFDQLAHYSRLSAASGIKQRDLQKTIDAMFDGHLDDEPIETWSEEELMQMDIPAPDWFVENFIVQQSLCIISGKSKSGKTTFTQGMSQAISSGADWMGHKTTKAKTLFFALEDTKYTLKERIARQAAINGINKNIDYRIKIKPLNGAGIKALKEDIIKNEYKFVVIDTLTSATISLDQMDGLQVSILFKALRKVCFDTGCTILLVDHQTKGNKEGMDVSDMHYGSMQKSAIVNFQMSFIADKANKTAVVYANGNHIPDKNMALIWDESTLTWKYEGEAAEVIDSKLELAVIDALKTYDGEATNKQIAEEIGRTTSHTNKVLKRMERKSIIERKLLEEKGSKLINILI